MTDNTYRQLPGMKRSFLGYSRLWMGTDHLLSVYSTGFSEDYKRFYYNDIESIVIQKTHWGKLQNLTVVIIFLTVSAAMIVTGDRFPWNLLLILMILLINVLAGPTCVCYLQTAVQIEKLPSLHRLKTAQKVVNLLKPLIADAQGTLSEEIWRTEYVKSSGVKNALHQPPKMP